MYEVTLLWNCVWLWMCSEFYHLTSHDVVCLSNHALWSSMVSWYCQEKRRCCKHAFRVGCSKLTYMDTSFPSQTICPPRQDLTLQSLNTSFLLSEEQHSETGVLVFIELTPDSLVPEKPAHFLKWLFQRFQNNWTFCLFPCCAAFLKRWHIMKIELFSCLSPIIGPRCI